MNKKSNQQLSLQYREAAKIQREFQKINKEQQELLKTVEALESTFFPPLENGMVFCPLCKDYFPESDYLRTVIHNKKTLWIANMVTHYRHTHIKSWNRCWDSQGGNRYRSGWFENYDSEKSDVNERAKRQIVRKCSDYLRHFNITPQDFEELEYNEEKTLELIQKKLSKKK
jgi:hypothetical protein